jgi:glycerophosphoryl diester phosphodiesterase
MTYTEAWPYPRVAAHRGGGRLAPENTLGALAVGASFGQRMVEFDVKLSADNLCFLLHDDRVDRTTNGRGAACNMRYEALAGLDAGSWFDPKFSGERLPTFGQAAARCRQLGLYANVEIKPCAGRERETGHQVAAQAQRGWYDAAVPPLLSSFSFEALRAARDAAPELPRGMLYGGVPADWRAQTEALGCVSLHADHARLSERLVAEIRASGLRVLAYTVNDPARARKLLTWGVDIICTDRIDLIGPQTL